MTARVTYSMNVSLDGYVNDAQGSLDWVDIDDEIHGWFNDRAREASLFVYGRRMYETMAAYWPFALDDAGASGVMRDFAEIWQPMPKLVFSRTLESVEWNSRLERGDASTEIARLKSEVDGVLEVGGARLAGDLAGAGLIDEYRLVVYPVALGSGTPYLPVSLRLGLRLLESRAFTNGAVLLRYAPATT